MLGHGGLGGLVDREEGLGRSPIPGNFLVADLSQCLDLARSHLADELAAECVDDTSHGRLLALADEVKVEHTLHCLGLHAAVLKSAMLSVSLPLQSVASSLKRLTRRNISSLGGREHAQAEGSVLCSGEQSV